MMLTTHVTGLGYKRLLMLLLASASVAVQAVTPQQSSAARKARQARTHMTETRAPRPDAPGFPVSPFDSSILAEIAACCCNLTNIVLACCSINEATIGSLTDLGVCDAGLWSNVDNIQNAQLSVISWLKTIMIELRGFCQPTPP